MAKIYCAVPFKVGFTNSNFGFRNCCSAHPQINSLPTSNFETWWKSPELEKFRQEFGKESFPAACQGCKLSEKVSGSSFRTVVNKEYGELSSNLQWPQTWNIMFGNKCNLGCWICNENSSSLIENQKKKAGLLPNDYVSTQQLYKDRWKTLKNEILKSYEFHPYVRLTIRGGEPLYNKDVIGFLNELIDKGLSNRTKLEFHTNATILSPAIKTIINSKNWNYTIVLLSLDAVGKKAEWLRYGCNWQQIIKNVEVFKEIVDYVQVNCTLSILNIMDLPALKHFCQQQNIKLSTYTLQDPEFLSLEHWPHSPDDLVDKQLLTETGFGEYYNLIGISPDPEAPNKLKKYIKSFKNLRIPLSKFDPELAKMFGVD